MAAYRVLVVDDNHEVRRMVTREPGHEVLCWLYKWERYAVNIWSWLALWWFCWALSCPSWWSCRSWHPHFSWTFFPTQSLWRACSWVLQDVPFSCATIGIKTGAFCLPWSHLLSRIKNGEGLLNTNLWSSAEYIIYNWSPFSVIMSSKAGFLFR